MEITGIVVAPARIEIRGNRIGAVFENGELNFMKVGKLQIQIDRDTSETNSEAAIREILIDPQEDLRPFLPDYWRSYLSGNDSKSRRTVWESSIEKRDPTSRPPAKVSPGAVSAPRVIHAPDPKYTKEAASKYFEGSSVLMVVINTSESPEDIAILSPLGMGLDEQAVKTVEQWTFKPAMKNGQPVKVSINIEIVFRCCP